MARGAGVLPGRSSGLDAWPQQTEQRKMSARPAPALKPSIAANRYQEEASFGEKRGGTRSEGVASNTSNRPVPNQPQSGPLLTLKSTKEAPEALPEMRLRIDLLKRKCFNAMWSRKDALSPEHVRGCYLPLPAAELSGSDSPFSFVKGGGALRAAGLACPRIGNTSGFTQVAGPQLWYWYWYWSEAKTFESKSHIHATHGSCRPRTEQPQFHSPIPLNQAGPARGCPSIRSESRRIDHASGRCFHFFSVVWPCPPLQLLL